MALARGGSAEAQEQAAIALYNLAVNNADNKMAIARADRRLSRILKRLTTPATVRAKSNSFVP